jgi:hypothetical protein
MNQHNKYQVQALTLVFADRNLHTVKTLYDIARVLMTNWPDDDGECYLVAVKACLDAITGEIEATIARRALVRAAEEAGIRMISVADCQSPGSKAVLNLTGGSVAGCASIRLHAATSGALALNFAYSQYFTTS